GDFPARLPSLARQSSRADTAGPLGTCGELVMSVEPETMPVGTRRSRAGKRAARLRLVSWAPLAMLVLLCGLITLVNPNFLSIGNFVRIAQTAMIPLVLGLGATFVILMGSIDLSVEGVLALGAVLTCMLVANGANANDLGLIGIAIVLATG